MEKERSFFNILITYPSHPDSPVDLFGGLIFPPGISCRYSSCWPVAELLCCQRKHTKLLIDWRREKCRGGGRKIRLASDWFDLTGGLGAKRTVDYEWKNREWREQRDQGARPQKVSDPQDRTEYVGRETKKQGRKLHMLERFRIISHIFARGDRRAEARELRHSRRKWDFLHDHCKCSTLVGGSQQQTPPHPTPTYRCLPGQPHFYTSTHFMMYGQGCKKEARAEIQNHQSLLEGGRLAWKKLDVVVKHLTSIWNHRRRLSLQELSTIWLRGTSFYRCHKISLFLAPGWKIKEEAIRLTGMLSHRWEGTKITSRKDAAGVRLVHLHFIAFHSDPITGHRPEKKQ